MSTLRQARRRDRAGEAGFTLLELLVALALFGLLSVALFGSIRFGMAAWTRGTMRADQVDQILHAQNLLRGLIEDAYPLFMPAVPAGGQVDFDGTHQSLDFLAPTPIARSIGGKSRFRITIARRAEAADLVLTSTAELAWPEHATQPITAVLLAGIRDAQFAYFGVTRTDRAPAWHAVWQGQTTLPQLLRLRVRLADGDTRMWPELLVAPRITADVSCVFDPLTNRCRGR